MNLLVSLLPWAFLAVLGATTAPEAMGDDTKGCPCPPPAPGKPCETEKGVKEAITRLSETFQDLLIDGDYCEARKMTVGRDFDFVQVTPDCKNGECCFTKGCWEDLEKLWCAGRPYDVAVFPDQPCPVHVCKKGEKVTYTLTMIVSNALFNESYRVVMEWVPAYGPCAWDECKFHLASYTMTSMQCQWEPFCKLECCSECDGRRSHSRIN